MAKKPVDPNAEVIEYSTCPATSLRTVKRTGLVPIVIDQPVPELGFLKGEIRGVLPQNAKVMIAGGYGHVHDPDKVDDAVKDPSDVGVPEPASNA